MLVRTCRAVKETLLSRDAPERLTLTLPGSGSKLIGAGVQVELTREEACNLLVEGFFPRVGLDEKPASRRSGFQEFGLPFAPDSAVTRYLAAFLTAHRHVAMEEGEAADHDPARPDVVLFNGGVFESPLLRARLLEVLESWFSGRGSCPLATDCAGQRSARSGRGPRRGLLRHGAAGTGGADRGRIGADVLHRGGIGGEQPHPCPLPGEGRSVSPPGPQSEGVPLSPLPSPLSPRRLSPAGGNRGGAGRGTGRAAVRSVGVRAGGVPAVRLQHAIDRQAGRVGGDRPRADDPAAADADRAAGAKEKGTVQFVRHPRASGKLDCPFFSVSVALHARLTEIGTLDLWLSEIGGRRSWRLQFDVRSATQTDVAAHESQAEDEGVVDEAIWQNVRR